MRVTQLEIEGPLIFEPEVLEDSRGFFFETFCQSEFDALIGRKINFVQDNHSISRKGVLRGIHYQVRRPQAKLVRVALGEIYDVAVDLRRDSSTYGHYVGQVLSSENKKQQWIPEGFAHGFLVLSESAEVLYKVTDYYDPQDEGCIIWNDEELSIRWPIQTDPILSVRDQHGRLFSEIFN